MGYASGASGTTAPIREGPPFTVGCTVPCVPGTAVLEGSENDLSWPYQILRLVSFSTSTPLSKPGLDYFKSLLTGFSASSLFPFPNCSHISWSDPLRMSQIMPHPASAQKKWTHCSE